MRLFAFALFPLMLSASNYTAQRAVVDGIEVVRLADAAHHAELSVVPSIGNLAYELKVNGRNILYFPYQSLREFRAKPSLCGVPLLAPWANRLSEDAFWANGKRYVLNPALGNIRRDPNGRPIHGLLAFAPQWHVTALEAGEGSARVTSRLEFWRHPDLMAQFPFAHTLEMTYRLANGAVEVETVLENHGMDPMPVAIGFHPYFQLPGAPRDSWKVHLAARDHLLLSDLLIPTGAKKPVEFPDPYPLAGTQLDDVFSGLVRSGNGTAEFSVEAGSSRVAVIYGPRYTVAIVYAPKGKEFICFEPMAAVTNAFNLAHEGNYRELQSVAPGGRWGETFRIVPSGL